MPIEVAGAIGAAPRFVMRCIHDLGTGCARPRVMAVHIVEIDEDAHRRHGALAGADHAPSLRTLAHHDALVAERHLRVHAAVRRGGAHLLLETECSREPFEGSRNVTIEDVGEDLCLGHWHGCTSVPIAGTSLGEVESRVLKICYLAISPGTRPHREGDCNQAPWPRRRR